MLSDRTLRWALVILAASGLAGGGLGVVLRRPDLADWLWAAGTIPIVAALAFGIVKDLLRGRFGVDAVALISMGAALAFWQPLAGAVVALMYSSGAVLEEIAIARAERNLRALIDRAPRVAHRIDRVTTADIPIEQVRIGDRLSVLAGEVIPVDGIVRSPTAVLDEAALTGEPLTITRASGETVFSGTINAGPTFEIEAASTSDDSAYAGIVKLVTAAHTAKAPFVRLADRYALIFLPFTLVVAGGAWVWTGDQLRALAVLVAATPCPLILAAPVAFIAGLAQAARHGVLVKGGAALEALARVRTVLFDKTGTLTVGGARLMSIELAPGAAPDDVLRLCASVEQASHHVVAAAIVKAAGERKLPLVMPEDVQETMGAGLAGLVEGHRVCAGSREIVFGRRPMPDWAVRAARRAAWRSALLVFVSVDGDPVGAILLADELRADAPRAIRVLRKAGVARLMMVTGDRSPAAQSIAAALDLDSVIAECVPADKVEAVRVEQRLAPTAMIGDGINDAPALAAADVGVAMGARGASASSEAADIVVLADSLDRVGSAIVIAQRARRIAMQSILVGMGLSIVAMAAAAVGWLAPVPAAVAQEAIDVAVIVNALRALRPATAPSGRAMPASVGRELRIGHGRLLECLDRLRRIADELDEAPPEKCRSLILEANTLIQEAVVEHERDDESNVYPKLSKVLADGHGLAAMSRAHREIQHLARLLARLADDLQGAVVDRYLIRDAQRLIEAIDILERVHSAQEEEIYEAVSAVV